LTGSAVFCRLSSSSLTQNLQRKRQRQPAIQAYRVGFCAGLVFSARGNEP
jgi:hypothetical protein